MKLDMLGGQCKPSTTPPAGEVETPPSSKIFDEALFTFLARIPEFKEKLKKRDLKAGKVTCPRCHKKTLLLTLRGTKDHIWVACANSECNFKMME